MLCYYYYLYKLETNFIVIVIVIVYCLIIFAWFNYGDQPAPLSAINWTQVFILPLRYEHYCCEVQANWSITFLWQTQLAKCYRFHVLICTWCDTIPTTSLAYYFSNPYNNTSKFKWYLVFIVFLSINSFTRLAFSSVWHLSDGSCYSGMCIAAVLLANNWGLVRYGLLYILHIRILITKNLLFTNWMGICFLSSTAIKALQSVTCDGITLAMLHCMRTIQWHTSSVLCVFVEPDCATPSDSWKVDSPTRSVHYTYMLHRNTNGLIEPPSYLHKTYTSRTRFSSAVPKGSGAFLMPNCRSSICPSIRPSVCQDWGERGVRNASVTFSIFLAWSFFGMTLTTYKKDLVE